MITFMEAKDKLKEVEKCLDSQLWHACAGGMVQMPPVNSKVFYFPQGHAEHSTGPVNFRATIPNLRPYILSRISAIKFMADPDTDEVYAKMKLAPIAGGGSGEGPDFDDDQGLMNGGGEGAENKQAPTSFAKTLTQSDANNGGGFSVPRYCAETIFPRLDYTADPPVQTILAKDVHGETWKFRHIYRGTPRRHLLTTGWSAFVNHKKLVAGDSIVFLRADNGDLCVGIRRAKRGIGGGPESSWNPAGGNCGLPSYGGGGFSSFLREEENKLLRNGNNGNGGNSNQMGRGKVRPESVIEAATRAANGQPFEVVYYPRASAPEFCVKASLVKAALQIRWCSGMRFKMAFETEDSSRISWFMGTISSVHFADPLHWPDSPWRLLQVAWDEPDLLQNVKRVSPWLVELVSNMPAIHLSPFSPPRKKLRLPHHPDFPLEGQFPMMPMFSGNLLGHSSPFGCLADHNTTPAGMQGARHAHYGLPLSDLHFNKIHTGLLPAGFAPSVGLDHHASLQTRAPSGPKPSMSENISCLLTMGNSNQTPKDDKPNEAKAAVPQFVLFGKPILTEQQISLSGSGDTASPNHTRNNSMPNVSDGQPEPPSPSEGSNRLEFEPSSALGTSHHQCRVFLESDEVGRPLDLSSMRSYDELHRKIADMFQMENPETLSNILYRDVVGIVRHIGDEPYSEFARNARRLTILTDSSSDNVGRRRQKK
ncbi:Auxin response factor 18 [Linum perenne]